MGRGATTPLLSKAWKRIFTLVSSKWSWAVTVINDLPWICLGSRSSSYERPPRDPETSLRTVMTPHTTNPHGTVSVSNKSGTVTTRSERAVSEFVGVLYEQL